MGRTAYFASCFHGLIQFADVLPQKMKDEPTAKVYVFHRPSALVSTRMTLDRSVWLGSSNIHKDAFVPSGFPLGIYVKKMKML